MQVEWKVKTVSMPMIVVRLLELRARRAPPRPPVVLDYAALTPALIPIGYVLYCCSYNNREASWGASHLAERTFASEGVEINFWARIKAL